MFVFGNLFLYLLLLVLCDQSLTIVTDDLMLELYSKYLSAVSSKKFTESTRRLLKKNREYEIHVTKLKEVNGFKKHNLFVKESLRSGGRGSFIYINNPVESKTPKAYLTLEEFKSALSDRVLKQKNDFTSKRRKKEITHSYSNILRSTIYKIWTQATIHIVQSLKNNTDTIKYNEKVNENESKINNNKVINIDRRKISTKKVSATNKNVHKKIVTNTEKVYEDYITLYFFTNITEGYTNVETEIDVSNQDINLDTTEPVTENIDTEQTISNTQSTNFEETVLLTDTTEPVAEHIDTEQTISDTQSTNFVETELLTVTTEPVTENTDTEQTISNTQSTNFEKTVLLTDTTDTSTVFENTLTFNTKSIDILSDEKNITNQSEMKKKLRRRKTTKSFSVPAKKRRVPLGVSFHVMLDINQIT